jgi:putative endonuclease
MMSVYIVASQRNGTLYIGVTSDAIGRVYKHKTKAYDGFTAKYNVTRLVYIEYIDDAEIAIRREKALKKWNRAWKIRLIESVNPNWNDLYPELLGINPDQPSPGSSAFAEDDTVVEVEPKRLKNL